MKEDEPKIEARRELDSSLFIVYITVKYFGIVFHEDKKSFYINFRNKLLLCLATCIVCYHTFSDVVYMAILLKENPKIENLVKHFHTFGYGSLSIIKLYTLWKRRQVFGHLIRDLENIWPVPPIASIVLNMKNNRLTALRIQHLTYTIISLMGIVFYWITPFVEYFYKLRSNQDAKMGLIWACWYPFDKYKPVNHIFVYIFEAIAGFMSLIITLPLDLLFTALACHLGTLFRMLNLQIREIGANKSKKSYRYILDNIKLHQRLIRYHYDMEEAFTLVNFLTVIISSANTCCALFDVILLDPLISLNNKVFLFGYLLQIFTMCWYADDIYYTSVEVAQAAFESNWYDLEQRSQRLVLFLINRSHKPLGFTALRFTTITLITFNAIISRTYSYFTLLYTMFNE